MNMINLGYKSSKEEVLGQKIYIFLYTNFMNSLHKYSKT